LLHFSSIVDKFSQPFTNVKLIHDSVHQKFFLNYNQFIFSELFQYQKGRVLDHSALFYVTTFISFWNDVIYQSVNVSLLHFITDFARLIMCTSVLMFDVSDDVRMLISV